MVHLTAWHSILGLRQSRVTDAAIVPLMLAVMWVASLRKKGRARMLGLISPATRPAVEPIIFQLPPQRPKTLTPTQARERWLSSRQ